MPPLPAPVAGDTALAGAVRTGAFTWHEAIADFKRRLLEHALASTNGNRTRAARALGLQRTYLLRLIRDLGITAPPASRSGDSR